MATSHVCGCFSNMQSRYKRLVNNVFPSNPSEGLVKSNMEKLTFYALQAPEKLDRIGDHMFRKTNSYLYSKKIDYVYISMEAMDHLLHACGSSSLNLFVESFLKMVTLLLESSEIGLQIRATNSFVKFANIDEDTPSYHRRYEFFISRFSQLCYGTNADPETEKKIRLSGLQGLQGVVRKTVNDDLQANIWDDTHMSRIVPSLLFNIECNSEILLRRSSANDLSQQKEIGEEQDNPAVPADSCLRELVSRAGFNNIAAILDPLLEFMDDRRLWLKNEFPLHIFKIVMYSIPNQYSYRAIDLLFSHLNKHKDSEADMRASIVEMISASVTIATGGSLGPSLLEVFNTLLKHLEISVDFMDSSSIGDITDNKVDGLTGEHPELLVQKAIINAAGTFSSILADYQRVDVMLFIIMKIPHLNTTSSTTKKRKSSENEHEMEISNLAPKDKIMQLDLLKCLLQVARSHQVKQFSSTFSPKLMDALLPGLCVGNPDVRRHVQEFWVLLLDRHNNLGKIQSISTNLSIGEVSFNIEKCSRQDLMFVKKSRQSFFFHIYEAFLLQSNGCTNMKMLSYLICLLLLECEEEDNIVELVNFVLGLQHFACTSENKLLLIQKACIHAMAVLFFLIVSELTGFTVLVQYCEEIISKRDKDCKWMLPKNIFSEDMEIIDSVSIPDDDQYYFERNTIVHVLKDNNYETSAIETPYVQKDNKLARALSIQSIPENFLMKKAESQMSIKSSSVYHHRASVLEAPVPKITYEDLKDALRGEHVERTENVLDFKKTSFNELVSNNERITREHENKIKKLLDVAGQCSYGAKYQQEVQKNLFEIEFPALFVY